MIQVDTREKPQAIRQILAEFKRQNIEYLIQKLDEGDYMSDRNGFLCIDRKQNLFELCSNIAQEEARFCRELQRATDKGIHLVILCEHSSKIISLQDLRKWHNPRVRTSKYAISGEELYRRICILQKKYDVEFQFCTKDQTGRKIISILGE
ncbi:MAG: ERCC4 domain-containing protein [Clostridia bacterium]|nr:ERCC4 domain-containing protein [Clostridia bacterium]